MKIIVLDIETTGFNRFTDAIVEVGMVLVDTNTKEIKHIFDKVVKDKLFNEVKHKDAWIFSNSTLKLDDVIKAKPLEFYREEIQGLLDKYPITAFNMKFDSGFMDSHKFKFKLTKCLMESSKPYNKNKDKRGGQKTPSVPEIYAQFFPEESYDEEHRGCDDAYHEGKILLKLVELKQQKENVPANT
jgi:DNA polymerase-3 subunit epsilon